MHPGASVSGLYFSHPQARYFAVDMIGRDQVESYAVRKGMPAREVERRSPPTWRTTPTDFARGSTSLTRPAIDSCGQL